VFHLVLRVAVFLIIFCTLLPQPAWAVADYLQEQKYLTDVWQLVSRNYYDSSFNEQNWYKVRRQFANRKFNSRQETYQAVREMLAVLQEPFTRLLEPDQFLSLKTSTSGELTGVGLQIALDTQNNSIVVVAPIADSPADRAGIRSLDRILKIDDVSTAGMTLDECATRMRGRLGSKVTLLVGRPVQPNKAITPVRPSDRAYQDAQELSATSDTNSAEPELETGTSRVDLQASQSVP
jgi:Periplasmic protease